MGIKFRTYVSQTGRKDVQDTIDDLDVEVIVEFSICLRYLANTPRPDWGDKLKKLKGVEGIYEIRFKANNAQQRALGFFGPEEDQFTITIWAIHKQDIYKPSDAIKSAGKRRDQIVARQATCDALKIDGEEFPPTE